jgi:hypothetical protein
MLEYTGKEKRINCVINLLVKCMHCCDVVPIYQDNKSNNPKVEITLVTFAAKQTASSST